MNNLADIKSAGGVALRVRTQAGPEPSLMHGGRTMGEYSEVFVAFDVAKTKHAVAIAEGGRTGEVRFVGEVENSACRSRG